ncbi:YafY family protein [Cohnella sp. WQ 127256]|uniref:helix-turn-helix transcriptional regulator n=1 Tax=Cohnella sp. WQ 127256 TaxID=2938790 RepID=UPI002117C093|nr:YafY family protein [Cohnella sp. WQ 127256]
MNKTDRMLAILLEIQRKGMQRAEDLASTFETSVRTIYRDVQALSEGGVPIIGTPGTGYSLMEGYFLPPISFSVKEAVTLLIGSDFIEKTFDRDYGELAKSAREKIEGVLPLGIRKEAEHIRGTMKLVKSAGKEDYERESIGMDKLRCAILEGLKVSFEYTRWSPDKDGNRQSDRTVHPYGLVLVKGSWILVGYCELRQDIRHFRLTRMTQVSLLEETFTFPPDFNLSKYTPDDDRHLEVRLLARSIVADRVKESRNFYIVSMIDTSEGLLIILRVRAPEDVLHWVLGWGADVKVLEPESLRLRVREEADRVSQQYR